MSAPLKNVRENELAIFLQTNEPIPARPFITFLSEIEKVSRLSMHFGTSASMEVFEVTTGTKLVRLTFDRRVNIAGVVIGAASLAVSVAALGSDLSDRMKKPSGRLAESLAGMCLDHGVAECVITTPEGKIEIARDQIPAIATLEDRRDRAENFGLPHSDGSTFSDGSGYAAPDSATSERALLRATERYADPRPFSDRVYTIVGKLIRPAQADDGPLGDWQISAQSGRTYTARGIDPARVKMRPDTTVVIRAQIVGVEEGQTILDVKDVFTSEEP
jgi:hypothetical protein